MADSRLSSVGPTRLVGHRVADLGEEVEVAERVTGLALGDRAEQRGDVGVALDVGLLREVQVAAVGLALAGERLLQVLLGLVPLRSAMRDAPFVLVVTRWVESAAVRRAASPRNTTSVVSMSKPVALAVGRRVRRRSVGVHVVHLDRTRSHTRWWCCVDVRVEAGRAGAEVELVDLAHVRQVVEGLVHGAQRDGRHLGATAA